jgi:hypothetical protein
MRAGHPLGALPPLQPLFYLSRTAASAAKRARLTPHAHLLAVRCIAAPCTRRQRMVVSQRLWFLLPSWLVDASKAAGCAAVPVKPVYRPGCPPGSACTKLLLLSRLICRCIPALHTCVQYM